MQNMSFRSRRLGRILFVICLVLCAPAILYGHDPGLSAADITLTQDGLIVALSFAEADIDRLCTLDSDHNEQISPEEFAAARPKLLQLAHDAFQLSLDDQPLHADEVTATYDHESNAVRFQLQFAPATGSRLQLRATIVESLARGHKQYLSLRDERGNILAERMLEAGDDHFDTRLHSSLSETKGSSFRRFVLLGIEHILTGYDHLAFLLALLLAGSTLREAGKIITSFTLAHSITLALATFDLVRIPPGVVEPLIAVSIVYVGFENLFRRSMKGRWLLTFTFGLIHGLGFASVLRELGIGRGLRQAITPLLSFNLGVEFGQIAIAALILPLVWKLRQRRSFIVTYVPACSLAIAVLGGYWLIERTFLK